MSEDGSPISSLADSWNVVNTHEIVTTSDSSDEDSIEVIEDPLTLDRLSVSNFQFIESGGSSSSETEEEDTFLPTSDKCLIEHSSKAQELDILSKDPFPPDNCYERYKLFAVFIIILLTGTAFRPLIVKVALDTWSYISGGSTVEDSSKDYYELLQQMKNYQHESKDLKYLVTDLNSAVEDLRKELVYIRKVDHSRESNVKEPKAKEKEPHLEEVLNHTSEGFASEGAPNESHAELVSFLLQLLGILTSSEEKERYLEAISLFFQIPKHLRVLETTDASNKHTAHFIILWKNKLSAINQKVLSDMDNMQSKIAKNVVNQFLCTHRIFYKNLCSLHNIKRNECYDLYIKPYYRKKYEWDSCEEELDKSLKMKNVEEQTDKTQSHRYEKHLFEKAKSVPDEKKQYKPKNRNGDPNKVKENALRTEKHSVLPPSNERIEDDPPTEPMSIKCKIPKTTDNKMKIKLQKRTNVYDTVGTPTRVEKDRLKKKVEPALCHPKKGMKMNLNCDDSSNDDSHVINTFSSFSEEKDINEEAEERFGNREEEGTWYLRMGIHRSAIREENQAKARRRTRRYGQRRQEEKPWTSSWSYKLSSGLYHVLGISPLFL